MTSPFTWTARANAEVYARAATRLYELTRKHVHKNLHLQESWALKAVSEHHLLEILVGVLGEQIAVENSFLMVKPPESSFVVPPHQDGINSRLELDHVNALSTWLALTDSTESSGALRIYRRSHENRYHRFSVTKRVRPSTDGEPVHIITPQNDSETEFVELKQGQGIAFNVRLVHDSNANRTSSFRIGLNVRYVNPEGILHRSIELGPLLLLQGDQQRFPAPIVCQTL